MELKILTWNIGGGKLLQDGADPLRNPQTDNLEMPDPQVDAAGFYSAAATMPALGYAIPNERP